MKSRHTLSSFFPTTTKKRAAAAAASSFRSSGRRCRRDELLCVGFDEAANSYHVNTVYSEEERALTWYTSLDIQQFRADCLNATLALNNNNHQQQQHPARGGGGGGRRRVHKKNRAGGLALRSFTDVLTHVYQQQQQEETSSGQNNNHHQQHPLTLLKRLFRRNPQVDHVGLEVCSCHDICVDQIETRRRLVCAVQFLQHDMHWPNNDNDNGDNSGAEAMATAIRRECQALTRPSRLFAQRLARARWEVATEQQGTARTDSSGRPSRGAMAWLR